MSEPKGKTLMEVFAAERKPKRTRMSRTVSKLALGFQLHTSQRQTRIAINALITWISNELEAGRRARVNGLGTFYLKLRKGRVIRNRHPHYIGNTVMESEPDYWMPKWKPTRSLRLRVRKVKISR
jgi:nucleoid DNA-binding protein